MDSALVSVLSPWNSYWHLFALVRDRFRPGSRLLDFGCGWGSNTVVFAKIGYSVDAFDISERNLDVARRLAVQHGVADRIAFHLMQAERLAFPSHSFDVVAGVDILHHVRIDDAVRECRRVLEHDGVAFFHEPVSNALVDGLRNTALARRVVPNTASFDRHITSDERKLDRRDLAVIRRTFPRSRFDRFRVLARLAALAPDREPMLQKLDWRLSAIPGYRSLAGALVMTLEN
jgi:2-polyprenyl-3-methyl-5-hydroxy-6-metoxy-1,4-benzoquinol methylase